MAAPNNPIYEKLGIPLVTDEEHEDLTQVLTSLGDANSTNAAVFADAPVPAPGDVKAPDMQNVYWINFTPAKLDPVLKARYLKAKENVDLNAQFMSSKAYQAVNEKVAAKVIPESAAVDRANYVAKVINYLAQNSPWIATNAIQTKQKSFKQSKDQLHNMIVKDFTDGIGLPISLTKQLEEFLTTVKNAVGGSLKAQQSQLLLVVITIYRLDDVSQDWQASLRTIYFKVNQSLVNFSNSKSGKTDGQDVQFDMDFVQTDGSFNSQLFETNAKANISASLGVTAKSWTSPNMVFDVPVDPAAPAL